MGRWGSRLFESDLDLDIAGDIEALCGEDINNLNLNLEVLLYRTRDDEHTKNVTELRNKLDSNDLGQTLLSRWRAKESEWGKYHVIIVGALLMSAGAKIKESEMQYLRETANQVTWVPDFALPIFDPGFRGPGKAQFLAALDHYQPGVPRDFDEPSCFYCGKVEVDIGKALTECGTCKMAWYCDKDCQATRWNDHKSNCTRA
ncbi:hypothetical protein F4821DRAFT_128030 [Hypoxylon rubiginosum]|uniref:Uncharacterized protein n=1 Tax=Hypoxylon rubiginosum TaxID=110542 RepID=A0ACC0D1R2_9PEZI|nr:hypothetical protein F4821DRAFT_128030 [Hypoxylon rubiginosum]